MMEKSPAVRSSRSPSKSRSRSSEKLLNGGSCHRLDVLADTTNGGGTRMAPPTFNVALSSPVLSNRRASAVNFTTTGNKSPYSHGRSRSLRSKRNSNFGVVSSPSPPAAPLRSAVGHSLSVPDADSADLHLVRNFSVTGKGVVNRGDSFRRSRRSSPSPGSPPTSPTSPAFPEDFRQQAAVDSSPSSAPGCSGGGASATDRYRVLLVGSNGVGKSALKKQFMTSEYICQYESWNDDCPKQSVSVSLDGEETEVELVECSSVEEKVRGGQEECPDAYIIVYSVTNRRSYVQAKQILSRIEAGLASKAAILVANKTDLARLRTVSTLEGRSLAKERGCKFIETSVAINHQVDELLVGIITQIRIKSKMADKKNKKKKNAGGQSSSSSSRSRATCIIKRLWRKTCMTSKSCDNLHAL